jgi:SAM-dependent methyltransferase
MEDSGPLVRIDASMFDFARGYTLHLNRAVPASGRKGGNRLLVACAIAAALSAADSARVGAQSSAVTRDVLYVPTPQPTVEAMLELARVTSIDVVYDLGSGDGRIVITAAKKYGARGVGIEIDPVLVKEATARAAAAGVTDKVQFLAADLFEAKISEATVVTLYLLQSINERLRPKLVRELKPGTRVVSHVFNMGPEWPPEKTMPLERGRIYLWTIGPR